MSTETAKTCRIENCNRPHYGKGLCQAHYKRARRYGDPSAGRVSPGSAQRFIDEALRSDTDECTIYPFYRNASGYGWMRYKGGNLGSHVVVAMRHHGPKPSSKHEVCHTCGNGHLGCVNPKHLYWGTRADNVQDAMAHGTAWCLRERPAGEKAHGAKYSDAYLRAARDRLDEGESLARVSKDTGISVSHLHRLKKREGGRLKD